jgi:SAM-dependent methyltransferase
MTEDSGFQVDADAPRYYQSQVGRFMDPLAAALVSTGVRADDSVLDIACGTGMAARKAAAVVGPRGSVVGADINAGMIRFAQGYPNNHGVEIAWDVASALELPYDDGSFDAVISQQGIQFFPDIAEGLEEMARVTRRGGRVSATVWSSLDDSPFFAVELAMLSEYCGTDPEMYRPAYVENGPSQMEAWFTSAGIDSVSIELLEPTVTLPPVRTYVPQHLKALPWSGSFFDLDERTKDEALAAVESGLADYATENGIEVPFRSYLATATVG